MGCGASSPPKELAALASAEFACVFSTPIVAPVTGTVEVVKTGKSTASMQDTGGNILLNISVGGNKDNDTLFIEPATGNTVVMVCLTEMGNLFTKKSTKWAVWTSTAVDGGALETTPNGKSMYKLGSFTMSPSGGPLEYFDAQGTKVLSGKIKSYSTAVVHGPDGASPAAVVEGMAMPHFYLKGKCSFAKGVDPVIAFAMASASLTLAG